MPNGDLDLNSLRQEVERSHRRELDLLRARLDDLAKQVENELSGLEDRIEEKLINSENRIADLAVHKAFAHLGVDDNDPKDLKVFIDDIRFGGVLRSAALRSFFALLAAIFGGIGLSAWMAFKDQFGWK